MKQSLFSHTLNEFLVSSNLSPNELVHTLQENGYLLRNDTLDRWCSGESLPRDYQAFQIAACMEDTLGVRRGTLCENLLHDLFPTKPFIFDEHIAPELVTLPDDDDLGDVEDSYSMGQDTDWTIDSHRLVVKDEIRISGDRKTILWNTTIGSLVPPVSKPSVEIGVHFEKHETPYSGKFILDTQGAYAGKESCVEQNGARTYNVHLILSNSGVFPGDISFCSYLWGSVSQVEHNDLAGRVFMKELDYYSCSVFFEGQAPRSAKYVVTPRHDDGKTEPVVTPLEVQNNFVKMAISDFGQRGKIGYIRYEM